MSISFRSAPSSTIDMQAPARNALQLKAYLVLSHDVMTGRHRPDQPFSLRPVAARLGMSAMPIREAVSRLIANRL